jgi:predicted dithiol-disulfide oxidoreductase (DUF899 family)
MRPPAASNGDGSGWVERAEEDGMSKTTHSISAAARPAVVERVAWQAEIDALRVREKAHTHEGDAIAAARRRLPMVEVDGDATLVGRDGPVALREVFEGRQQLIAYFHMWYPGKPAAEQCEGCTLYNSHIRQLSYLHSRDVTYATFCQGPYEESVRYRDFLGLEMPWYSVLDAAESLLAGRTFNRFYLVFYLRQGERVFETYWTHGRGVEVMAPGYVLLDRTVYGRQEAWEGSPAGWPQPWVRGTNAYRTDENGRPTDAGRPIAQWPRLATGRSDDLEIH